MTLVDAWIWWKRNGKAIALGAPVLAALGGLGAYAGYLPATRGWVVEIVDSKTAETRRSLEERIVKTERRQTETQLQVNTLRRDALESQKFDLDLKIQGGGLDPYTRGLIDQQMRRVNEGLQDVQQERSQIRSQQ